MSRKYGYRFRSVTLAGDVLNAGGSMSGGSLNKQSGFLSRAAEIKSLTSEINELSGKMRNLTEEKHVAESEIALADGQLSSFVPLVREYEDEILRLENTERMLKDSLEKSESTSHEQELGQIEEKLKETADSVAELISGVSSLKNKNKELEEKIAGLIDERNELISRRDECDLQARDISEQISELGSETAAMRQSVTSAYAEINSSRDETARRTAEEEQLIKQNEEYNSSIEKAKIQLEKLREYSQELRTKLSEIDRLKKSISDQMNRSRGANKDITNKLIELQKELTRIENKSSKLQTERDSVLNRIWDDYEMSFGDLEEQSEELEDPKEAAKQLSEYRKKIRALGSVNIDSIEEYKNVKERYEFMTSQKADLEKSKDNLVKIIESMEELMKEHFSEQFAEINKAFGEVFAELFGGGSGRLELSDPDDILTTGIEIEVQLPGKGTQNINLYSGGEKSFIAIALLFAILKVKPTPFCILDEIDAALDDVNVSRFATYLKNYTDHTQFIVITHRRGTMEAASILYGVTMQESGVSKLLSLKIDDVADELVK